jgi:hypothetical protein
MKLISLLIAGIVGVAAVGCNTPNNKSLLESSVQSASCGVKHSGSWNTQYIQLPSFTVVKLSSEALTYDVATPDNNRDYLFTTTINQNIQIGGGNEVVGCQTYSLTELVQSGKPLDQLKNSLSFLERVMLIGESNLTYKALFVTNAESKAMLIFPTKDPKAVVMIKPGKTAQFDLSDGPFQGFQMGI